MKKQVLFLALMASSTAVLAQANFRPGYIVSLAGDTARGTVDYRGEERNALLCRFKTTADAVVAEYQPGQIRGYGFTNGRDLQSWALPGAGSKAVFVQTLVLGKASLYHSVNEHGKDVYYAGGNSAAALEALIQQDTIQSVYDQQQRRTTTMQQRTYPFRSVLWRIMADCPSVQTTVARLELKEGPLVKTFSAYNTCVMGSQQQYVAKQQTSKTHFMVLGGVKQATISYGNHTDKKLESGFGPSLGIGIMFQPGRFNPRFLLHLQALYQKQEYQQEFNNGDELVHVNLTSIQVPLFLRYTLPTKKVQPYVQAGVLSAINPRREAARESGPSRPGLNAYSAIDVRSYNLGLMGGAGLSMGLGKGSMQLEVRTERLDGTSEVITGDHTLAGAQGFSLLLGYTFGQ
ncbi:outer membrane beta-barrel protein [Hymenobacter cellulosilyticus]|uniref:PorT family protein n=1 Tax=Hymenobacter cellulosilyticus TaxID=2932248 RepID=A0A8T9Q572_9BACT|nr:outer membrane beta-barrel protein [Hymenobacter cellulosilyticus]UOQ72714.1 PorT family protein [Hymenobacter cellulosilyticus]